MATQPTTIERTSGNRATVPQPRSGESRPRPRELSRAALAGLPAEFVVLDRFTRPGVRFARIDHVVVGPGGVFVVASAPGDLELSDGELRHGELDCSAGLTAVAEAAAAVAELLPRLDPAAVTPVLCLARDEDVDDVIDDVLVCTAGNLGRLLAAWPPVLDAGHVGLLGRRLAVQQQPATGPVAVIPQPRRARGLRGLLSRG